MLVGPQPALLTRWFPLLLRRLSSVATKSAARSTRRHGPSHRTCHLADTCAAACKTRRSAWRACGSKRRMTRRWSPLCTERAGALSRPPLAWCRLASHVGAGARRFVQRLDSHFAALDRHLADGARRVRRSHLTCVTACLRSPNRAAGHQGCLQVPGAQQLRLMRPTARG